MFHTKRNLVRPPFLLAMSNITKKHNFKLKSIVSAYVSMTSTENT